MADGQVVFSTELDAAGIKSGLDSLEKDIAKWSAKAAESLSLVAKINTSAATSQFSSASTAVKGLGENAQEASSGLDDLKSAVDSAGDEAKEAAEGFEALGEDAEEAGKAASESSEELKSVSQTINSWGKAFVGSKIFSEIADGLWEVTKAGIEYNAQMEAYQTNFGVLLGDQAKALEHVAELREMAAKTPFGMEDLANASQTMLSFGLSVDDTMNSLQMLGDISLGNQERFSSLSLAFAQVSAAGKLTGNDLLQMVNSGFNPLNTIAEKTGTSLGDLKEVMGGAKGSKEFQKQMKAAQKEVKKLGDNASEGAKLLAQIGEEGVISAELVGMAMYMETSPGGRFYKGMEMASQTMGGLLSTLKDDALQLAGNVFEPLSNVLTDTVLPAAIGAVGALNDLFEADGSLEISAETQEAVNKVNELDQKITDVRTKYLTEAIEIQVKYDRATELIDQLDTLSSRLKTTPKELWTETDQAQLASLNSQLGELIPNFQSLVDDNGLLTESIGNVKQLTAEYYNLALAKAASAALEEAYAVQLEADLEVKRIEKRISRFEQEKAAAEAAAEAYEQLSDIGDDLYLKVDDFGLPDETRFSYVQQAIGYLQSYIDTYGNLAGLKLPGDFGMGTLFDMMGNIKPAEDIFASADAAGDLATVLQKLVGVSAELGEEQLEIASKSAEEIQANQEALSIAKSASAEAAQTVTDLTSLQADMAQGTASVAESTAAANAAIDELAENATEATATPYEGGLDFDNQPAMNAVDKAVEAGNDFASQVFTGTLNFRTVGAGAAKSALESLVPGYADGLDYVPYDNYLALLHKGEQVLTAEEASALRRLSGRDYASKLASRAFMGGSDQRAVSGDTIVHQTINFNQPVQTPDEFARMMKLYATYGL